MANFDLLNKANQAAISVVNELADIGEEHLRSVTSSWQRPLELERRTEQGKNKITVTIATSDKRFVVQQTGMEPKVIKPKNAKMLAFNPAESDYPKTNPFKSNKGKGHAIGRRFTNDEGIVFMDALYHPGIQKQEHLETASKKMAAETAKILSKYFK